MVGIVAGSQLCSGAADVGLFCILDSDILDSDVLDSDILDSDILGSDMMRSMRRATVLLRSVAWLTSARGARVPSSGSVVISSTISTGSGLALR
jgi:hypothetical protein